MHDNFVLVPADKANNNVIVVCKKYYLDVVIIELGSTNTYKKVNSDCMSVINRHLDYMLKSELMYVSSMKGCHHFTGYLNYIKHHTEPDSLLPLIDVPLNSSLLCLHLALKL